MGALLRKLQMDGADRYEEAALFALRAATGLFLLYQSHDNVLSAARMDEFEGFMAQFGFWRPEILAPFAIFWQVAAGIGFILGLFVRPLGLITAIQFIVAVWMVHWSQDYALWGPGGGGGVSRFLLRRRGRGAVCARAG